MSSKRSVAYASGAAERLQAGEVTNIPSLTIYARQELGISYPVGQGRREAWMGWLMEEMEVHGWQIQDLVRAVDYIKSTNAKCRTLQGICWYVEGAKDWSNTQRKGHDYVDLHSKVARALNVEDDSGWQRKLSLARGRALEQVYAAWETQRMNGGMNGRHQVQHM